MPVQLIPARIVQITKLRTVRNFTVNIPDDGTEPYAVVVFAEIEKLNDGSILRETTLPQVKISKARLLALLPGFGLPSFAALYSGLSELFHAEWDAQNP